MAAGRAGAVAVTGATGFIGGSLARRLRAEGRRVFAHGRDRQKLAALEGVAERLIAADVADLEAAAALMEGADAAIHTVSNFRSAKDSPEAHRRTNVEGSVTMYRAACAAGLRRFVHCSTIGVHGHVADGSIDEDGPFAPGDLYQETKLEAELAVRDEARRGAAELVVIRPCSVYGPGDLRMLKMFRSLAARRFPLIGPCRENFHAVYIDDLVDAFLLALDAPQAAGETFIIGGSRFLPLADYIAEASRAVGAPPPAIRLPYGPIHLAAELCEAVCRPLRVEPPLHVRRVRFFRNNRAFRIDRARRKLGYEPKVELSEGLRRTVAWYREQKLL
jgi:dihydroflavonol-4-reductase